MSTVALMRRVARTTGTSADVAGHICEVTVRAIGEQLAADRISTLAMDLPPTVGSWLSGSRAPSLRGLKVLLARVASQDSSIGPNEVRAVCEALAEAVRPGTLITLRSSLPADVAAFFADQATVARQCPTRASDE
jgi:uncharacterized protein (DUF2267 family)